MVSLVSRAKTTGSVARAPSGGCANSTFGLQELAPSRRWSGGASPTKHLQTEDQGHYREADQPNIEKDLPGAPTSYREIDSSGYRRDPTDSDREPPEPGTDHSVTDSREPYGRNEDRKENKRWAHVGHVVQCPNDRRIGQPLRLAGHLPATLATT